MAFSVVQIGDTLQLLSTDGELTELALPTGITINESLPPRWTTSGRYVICVNSPSLPLTIDGNGKVRLLTPRAPRLGPTVSSVSGGALTGTYAGLRYTFVTLDEIGNIIAESDYSPASGTVTFTTDFLKVSGLDLSPDEITARRIYRPTTNGSVLFQWIDLDGNTLTEVQDDLADAGLALFASPILGSAPYLTHVADFRGRLFGVPGDRPDVLRFTEAGFKYSWPSDNLIPIQPEGSDQFGVTAVMARRDSLGVARRNQLWQIVGSGAEVEGIADFEPVRLSEILGVLSQESVDVYRDTAYFLWYDGVYKWNAEGISCVSDGKVRSWFTTDDYFNRERFRYAFGKVDPVRLVYKLFLASADSDFEDSWVEYDLREGTWWGPHNTMAFVPTSLFGVTDATGTAVLAPSVGNQHGDIYQEQDTRSDEDADGVDVGIPFDVIGKRHDGEAPDQDKYFGRISLLGKPQTAGTLSVVTRAGELNATTTLTQSYNMTLPRQVLGRVGHGKHAEVELINSVAGVDVEVYGYTIDDVHLLGRR